jgi:hypothetical protein
MPLLVGKLVRVIGDKVFRFLYRHWLQRFAIVTPDFFTAFLIYRFFSADNTIVFVLHDILPHVLYHYYFVRTCYFEEHWSWLAIVEEVVEGHKNSVRGASKTISAPPSMWRCRTSRIGNK